MQAHPYYAGLHYGRRMEDLLRLEWASFRLRGIPDEKLRELTEAGTRAEEAGEGDLPPQSKDSRNQARPGTERQENLTRLVWGGVRLP